jgi:hypothetical protein
LGKIKSFFFFASKAGEFIVIEKCKVEELSPQSWWGEEGQSQETVPEDEILM